MPERLRWLLAIVGALLWLSLVFLGPWQAIEARSEAWRISCVQRRVRSGQDPCFSDYIPAAEMIFLPLIVLAAAFPMIRLAFSLFAPPPERRQRAWRLALSYDSSTFFSTRLIIAAGLIALALWSWLGLPRTADLAVLHSYWAAASVWLLVAIAVRFLDWLSFRRNQLDPSA